MKFKFVFLQIIFFFIFVQSQINAQVSYNFCSSISISPNQVTVKQYEPLSQGIEVTAKIKYFDAFNKDNFEFFIYSGNSTIRWQIANATKDGSFLYLSSTISPANFGDNFINNQQFIFTIETKDGHSLTTENNQPCTTALTILTDESIPLRGSCSGYENTNNATCTYYNGRWIPSQNYCNEGYFPQCYQQPFDPDAFPFKEGTCLPCIQKITNIKKHGDVCDSNEECGALKCRPSAVLTDKKKCLYPEYTIDIVNTENWGTECIIGENECRITSSSITYAGQKLICGNINEKKGTLSSCQKLSQECNENIGVYCKDGQECIDNVCQQKRLPTTYIPRVTERPSPTPPNYSPPMFVIVNCTPKNNVKDQLSEDEGTGVLTAFGCLPTSLNGITQFIFTLALGIGGGIAFLLILFGGLRILTSTGDPKSLQTGREIVTSAVVGLLLILFSIIILRIIGINILGIPGFG